MIQTGILMKNSACPRNRQLLQIFCWHARFRSIQVYWWTATKYNFQARNACFSYSVTECAKNLSFYGVNTSYKTESLYFDDSVIISKLRFFKKKVVFVYDRKCSQQSWVTIIFKLLWMRTKNIQRRITNKFVLANVPNFFQLQGKLAHLRRKIQYEL